MADPVVARIIRGVAVTAALVAAHVGYHFCTSDHVIHGVDMATAHVASLSGNHSYNSRIRSRNSWVDENIRSGYEVNVL